MPKQKKGQSIAKTMLTLMLALLFSLTSTVAVLADGQLDLVRSLLQSSYYKPVDQAVLDESSVATVLTKLGDPYTVYFTAQEYEDFFNSVDMTFTGIGIYFEIVPQGVLVTRVIPDAPSDKAGLKTGDILIKSGDQTLVGISSEMVRNLLRGPAGTSVDLTVLRATQQVKATVMRAQINIPTVTGELVNGHIGYIALESFGTDTVDLFKQKALALRQQGADSWIIDLRNNPGGYLHTVQSIAGCFIGERTAVQTKSRDAGMVESPAYKQDLTLNEPMVILANEYSASASEILAALVKDYSKNALLKAAIIGNKTFGKGTVQTVYTFQQGGATAGAFKMTIAEWFSPLGIAINKVGVSPDLKITKADPKRMAELLLDNAAAGSISPSLLPQSSGAGSAQAAEPELLLNAAGRAWGIPLAKARKAEYWPAYAELVQNSTSHNELLLKNGNELVPFSESDWSKKWPLFYPKYQEVNALQAVPLNKKFTVKFNAPLAGASINADSVELIESESGARVAIDFGTLDEQSFKVIPRDLLKPGKTYWLLMHKGLQSKDGRQLSKGVVAVARTVTETATLKIQSASFIPVEDETLLGKSDYENSDFKPAWTEQDYGLTIVK